MRLVREFAEPVLTPRKDVPWEKDAVLNSAVVLHGGKIHLLYRAVAHNPGDLNRSCIGYACSEDGEHFERLDQPVLASGECPEEAKGVEDPRVTLLGDTFYMLYSAWDEVKCHLAMACSKDLLHWTRMGIAMPYDVFGHNKNACLLPEKIGGRYAMLHRPMGKGPFFELPADVPLDIWMSFSDDLRHWTDHRCAMKARPNHWDEKKIGIAGPPIRTEEGWLLVYHGVDRHNTYRLGIALLDAEDPSKVLRRQDEPILEPEREWEHRGDVPNVVFSCGALLLGSNLLVYYGGADSVIGLAKGNVDEFLQRRVPAEA